MILLYELCEYALAACLGELSCLGQLIKAKKDLSKNVGKLWPLWYKEEYVHGIIPLNTMSMK